MPAERPVSKASENRRATKPIMEKRRRARINQCLSELKTLILDALNKDPSRHSKLEKADILEMTVHHLQNIQRQQMAAAISTDSSVLNKFKAGFNECATEVSRYVGRIEGLDPHLRQRLLAHLSTCLSTMNQPPSPSPLFQQQQHSFGGMLSVQIPAAARSPTNGDINNNNNERGESGGKLFAGLSVIPSRLPNGDFAFLLPSQALTSGSVSFQLPSVSASSSSVSLPSSSSGMDRNSQSSWAARTSERSPSPDDAMSEDNVVLSPTCSDAGSDVFLEPTYKHHPSPPAKSLTPPYHHHQHHQVDRATSPHHHHKDRHQNHHQGVIFPPLRHRHVSETESVWRPW